MPSYLDFNSTKKFRDFILSKTLSVPDGPKTVTSPNYTVQNLSDLPNTDPGAVDTDRNTDLLRSQVTNIYKPLKYMVKDNFYTIPRRANLSLYPYFVGGQNHNLVGIMNGGNYDTESELFKFAAAYIKDDIQGPVHARIQQNLYAATVGKIRIMDALDGNLATASNILTGKEPLIEANGKITVAKTLSGKGIDFLQTITGTILPWPEIPGDYLTDPQNPINYRTNSTQGGAVIRDVTAALGSLIGIQRRPEISRKPSDLFIEYMGERQKLLLFDNLSYSKYAPNYTTTAMSQNSSKIFNFIDRAAQGVKNLLGIEAPNSVSYIGDDRSNSVRYAMNDFYDRPVKSGYYLSLMFDPIQTRLFERTRNISEGGAIGSNLTWISVKTKVKLGANNPQFSVEETVYMDSLSTKYKFNPNSLLSRTQEILDSMPDNGNASRTHVANVIDQTSRIFRDGDTMMSKGSAIKYVDKYGKNETGIEYCRVWTKDRPYMTNSDTMKKTTLIRKFDASVMSTPWNLNIYPNSNGNKGFDAGSTNMSKRGDGFYAKKYMFSIENLAWKTSGIPGFQINDLPYCERGSNGGRIMWFPPYDLKVQEQNNAKWEENTFLGRPEPVYTYQNTSRTGTVSFKVIVDHPSILNLLVSDLFKNMTDEEADNYINAFFAGCVDVDFYGLIRKYTTLSPSDIKEIQSYLNGNGDSKVFPTFRSVTKPTSENTINNTDTNQTSKGMFSGTLNFDNNSPSENPSINTKENYGKSYSNLAGSFSTYKESLNKGLNILLAAVNNWSTAHSNDYFLLTGNRVDKAPSVGDINSMITKVNNDIDSAFTELTKTYSSMTSDLTKLKSDLDSGNVGGIDIQVSSSTSYLGSDTLNMNLSYRRSNSVINEILKGISKNGVVPAIFWYTNGTEDPKTIVDTKVPLLSLRELGYDLDGNITFSSISNSVSNNDGSSHKMNCSDPFLTSETLNKTSPASFWCRESTFKINVKYKQSDSEPKSASQVVSGPPQIVVNDEYPSTTYQKPPIDELKKIIMKTLSECYYFKKLEEESPVQFTSLKEKLKYFHPSFHSMTPEGLNARLTFLHQCIRPGDTIPIKGVSDETDLNARNTTFGAPPICVMRIGDFYNSKIAIKDVNIVFDENVWDFNPEGIGVQPMIANVTLQVNFIGGHGLEKPVERLQNALSSNFYANTEIYDPRSETTNQTIGGMDAKKFTTNELNELLKTAHRSPVADNSVASNNKVISGIYIGKLDSSKSTLEYTELIEDLYSSVGNYYSSYISAYNTIVKQYGYKLGSMFLSPEYRTTYNYTVETGSGTDNIQLFGNYVKNNDLSTLSDKFKTLILDKISTTNISTLIFGNAMAGGALQKSEAMLNPYVSQVIAQIIDGFTSIKSLTDLESSRNKVILMLDKLNFIVNTAYDGKIDGDICYGINLSGYTATDFYSKYEDIIKSIKNNSSEFTVDLEIDFSFGTATTMSDSDFSDFLSVLLNTKTQEILNLYINNPTIYSKTTVKTLETRLTSFLLNPSEKSFKITNPLLGETISVIYNAEIDPAVTFTSDQQNMLKNTFMTGSVNPITTLNYAR